MRILFGVQGTGNGHISRSRTLARALKSRGVAVDYLFSGRAADGVSRRFVLRRRQPVATPACPASACLAYERT